MQTLGEKIYNLRNKAGLSQEELSYAIDVSRQAVSKWETGEMQPSMKKIQVICRYFNVSPNYFFEEQIVEENIKETVVNTGLAVTKSKNSKTKTILFIAFIIVLISMTIISAICGGIFLYLKFEHNQGVEAIKTADYDVLGIFFFVLAIVFAITVCVLIVYIMLKKRKKN